MIVAGLSLLEEVPRHPRRRIRHQLTGVPLELGEVIERIGVRQLTGVDQTHEQVAHFGAMQGAIKQRIFAMQYSAFEGAFADIVIEGRTRIAQEGCQSFPVPEEVGDRFAQARVGFAQVLGKLDFHPIPQGFQERLAMLLMKQ
jgi:hypothetical protein